MPDDSGPNGVPAERSLADRITAESTTWYRFRLLLLALFGPAFVIGLLALALSVAALILFGLSLVPTLGYMAAKIGWPVLVLILVILRSFLVRFPPPNGIELTRGSAPELWREVEQLRGALDAFRVHRILLTGECNCAVIRHPQLGLLGWWRNYLQIGLPFLIALDRQQFRAVITHEIAHLSKRQGQFGSWIRRCSLAFHAIAQALMQRRVNVVATFFNWYVPFFERHAMALSRAHEFEADRLAADIVGRRPTGEALIATELWLATVCNDFWAELFTRVRTQPLPPASPFAELAAALRRGPDREHARAQLAGMIPVGGTSDTFDSHPRLAERLRAIGAEAEFPSVAQQSAAESYIGDQLPRLTEALDATWRAEAAESWQAEHERLAANAHRLAELETLAAAASLAPDQAWERATLIRDQLGSEAALTHLRAMLAADPGHALARHALGVELLAQDDPEGIQHLEQAMALAPETIADATEMIAAYLEAHPDYPQAEAWRARLHELTTRGTRIAAATATVGKHDSFTPHDFPHDVIQRTGQALDRFPQLETAHLVCRRPAEAPEITQYILTITLRYRLRQLLFGGWKHVAGEICEAIAAEVRLPKPVLVLPLEMCRGRRLRRRIAMPEARIPLIRQLRKPLAVAGSDLALRLTMVALGLWVAWFLAGARHDYALRELMMNLDPTQRHSVPTVDSITIILQRFGFMLTIGLFWLLAAGVGALSIAAVVARVATGYAFRLVKV